MDWTSLIAIVVSLILIGFFTGIETAFISVNKLSLELRKKQGTYSGRIWSSFMEKPTRFIGTILLVFNVLVVVYGLLWSNIFKSVWRFWGIDNTFIKLGVETVIATVLLLFFEVIFKAFFRATNIAVTGNSLVSFIVQFFYSMFAWFASLFISGAEWMLKYIFNVKIQNKNAVFTKVDLEHFIQQRKMHDVEDSQEMNNELFENVLSLADVKVRACLIPRKEIEAVNIDSTIPDLKARFKETKLSKLVVYEGNIDNIQGYIHQLDMFKNPETLRSILLPIPTIPESMSASDLIDKFSRERKSIAWVIDEFGGTAGIVTMEDLLEEIFGDINDEYDETDEFVDKRISTTEYVLSGRLELDYLINKYKMYFRKNEETETLSGYIISQHEAIPRQKDRIIIDNYQFDILSVSETRIETVKLKVLR
jgi:CBS domain containing-hemolysin-like protein